MAKSSKVSAKGAALRTKRENDRLAKAQDAAANRVGRKLTSDSFQNFALSLGLGTDTPMSASTYGFNPITRTRILLEWVHRGSWIGGVAIDLIADDMTRAGVDLEGDMDPEDMERLEEHVEAMGIWEAINDTIKWSRLYGGCLAVMLIEGQKYDTPLRLNTIGKNQFRGLAVLDRWMVEPSIGDLITEPGPHLGLPKYYRVMDDAPIRIKERIHHTRCLRLEGIHLPYYQRLMENMWGLSIIERLYDRLVAFDAATQGASQLVHKSYLRTLKMAGLREALTLGGDAEKGVIQQVSMMRRMQQNEGITITDGDDEFKLDTSSGYAGIGDIIMKFGEQISGALQVPLVRLFGQSPAGFSSGEADLRMYYDGILQQQRRHLKLPVTRIYRAVAASIGVECPEGFAVKFRPLWQLTEKEQAETAVVGMNAINEALTAGILDKPTAMKEAKQLSDITGIFSNITDEQIEQAEEEASFINPPGTEGLGGPQAGTGEPGAEAEPTGAKVSYASSTAPTTPKAPEKKEEEAPAGGQVANKPKLLAKPEKPNDAEDVTAPGVAKEGALSSWPQPEQETPPQFDGLDYQIETKKGEIRQPWGVKMPSHYGYIKGTGSAEGWGEGMDCFVGDDANSKRVFVVTQKNLETGQFDEHKCLMGFPSAAEAYDCYVKSFNDGKGAERIMRVDAYAPDAFKKWLHANWRVERAKA